MNINDLSNDLLAAVLAAVRDSSQLRAAAPTCRRWAVLLRERLELWRDVQVVLPPKRSRGRDRRNSYTTPCRLNTDGLVAWLAHRAATMASLEVALKYPDAIALLPALLPPLAPALRRLVLRGSCSNWPYLWVDWRWLAGMTQLEALEMWNALPGMGELALPPSLTELIIDRVGEADTEGWDELPECFTRLTRLRKLMLGTAATYQLRADEESAFTPLRAASGLHELRLTEGALSAVPDALTALQALTLLSFGGCDRLEAFGEMCQHKADPFQPLGALTQLRFLDFGRCGLERMPSGLSALPELRTLLLSDNQLTCLPSPAPIPALSAALPAGEGASVSGSSHRRHQPQPAAYDLGTAAVPPPEDAMAALPLRLERLVLAGNCFASLPAVALTSCSGLAELDLSRCWQLQPTPAEWRALLGSLPCLRLLRHSCPLLAVEARGHGGGVHLAATLGASPELQLDFCSTSGSCLRGFADVAAGADITGGGGAGSLGAHGSGAGARGSKQARSCGCLQELEAVATTLLSTGMSAGMRATLAELAATASGSRSSGDNNGRGSTLFDSEAAGVGAAMGADAQSLL